MKRALLLHGSKQTPVTVEETSDGGLIVHLHNKELFRLEPVAEAASASAPAAKTRMPQMADLTGDPAHDWPLFVQRFQKSQPDLLTLVAHYYKKTFHYSTPSIEAVLRADEDLEALLPILPDLLTFNGELKRGHRARIGDQLGVKDAGNYRGRISAVIGLILNNLEELLASFGPKLGNFSQPLGNSEQKADLANKTNVFQEPRKTANE